MISKTQLEKSNELLKEVCSFVGSKVIDGDLHYSVTFRSLTKSLGVNRQTFHNWSLGTSGLNPKNLSLVKKTLDFERERSRKIKVCIITKTETF